MSADSLDAEIKAEEERMDERTEAAERQEAEDQRASLEERVTELEALVERLCRQVRHACEDDSGNLEADCIRCDLYAAETDRIAEEAGP